MWKDTDFLTTSEEERCLKDDMNESVSDWEGRDPSITGKGTRIRSKVIKEWSKKDLFFCFNKNDFVSILG